MSISTKAKVFLWSFLVIITIGFGSLAGALFGLLRDLPDLKGLEDYTPGVVTSVYSDNDQVVAEFFQERRVLLPFEKIPPQFVQALLAAEDVDFYEHWGINTKGIMRAFIMNIKAGHVVQGGSTLTQQLAKVLFLTPERTLTRKLKEFMLAMQIEKKYTKNEILQMYCNQIYLGSGSYGLESAARTYFGKSVSELKLNQFALLAGLPKGPELYSPFNSQERAVIRMQYVLRRMLEENFITKKEFDADLIAPLKLRVKGSGKKLAPHFSEMVRQYLEQKYGVDMLYRKGLKVYTTLNIDFQIAAERAVIEGLDELKARHKFIREKKLNPEAALISLEPDSGNIKAMVGGASFARSKFNRAVQAKRQPGSAFKTIIYAAALDDGFTPASLILDEPIAIKNAATGREWRPANFDQEFLGPVTVRKALEESRNVVTIKLLEQLGAKTVIDYARRLGIESYLHEYLSLALGTSEVTLWELTGAYQVIANQGVRVEPNYLRYITDKEGKMLEETVPVSRRVLSAQTSYLVTSLLRGVVQHGTGWRARELGRPAAGKTGTTDDYKDAWFMGFVPQLTTGVWVGFDRKQRLGNMETGSRAASPIWVKFMQKAITHYPVEDFKVPEGVVFVDIDAKTGLLATPRCEKVIKEAFRQGTEPVESCKDLHESGTAQPEEVFPDEEKAEPVLQEE